MRSDYVSLILSGLYMQHGTNISEAIRIENHLAREGRGKSNEFSREARERAELLTELIAQIRARGLDFAKE